VGSPPIASVRPRASARPSPTPVLLEFALFEHVDGLADAGCGAEVDAQDTPCHVHQSAPASAAIRVRLVESEVELQGPDLTREAQILAPYVTAQP
jgi:hypothetical protein